MKFKKTSVNKDTTKKLSLKEKLEAKKLEAKKNKKKPESTIPSRGRPKGIRYIVPKKYEKIIISSLSDIEDNFNEFKSNLNKFIEAGNKSSVKNGRLNLQEIVKTSKKLRKILQEAKINLEQQAI